jgi:SAM-dependent methyltransferase
MHASAYEWVRRHASAEPLVALDIGGRDINSTKLGMEPCALFPGAAWTGLDIHPGPGVDVVADAATWAPDRVYDLVLCTEVLEHTPAWRNVLGTCRRALRHGGLLLLTTAGRMRLPHSASGGRRLRPGEHYANLDPDSLYNALCGNGFTGIVLDEARRGKDLRASAVAA